jgi:hypothetical protein
MDMGPATVTIAAKLPAGVASEFALLAEGRAITRSALVRAMIEGAVDGSLPLPSDGQIEQRELAKTRARMQDSFRQQAELREHQKANPRRFGLRELIVEELRRREDRPAQPLE